MVVAAAAAAAAAGGPGDADFDGHDSSGDVGSSSSDAGVDGTGPSKGASNDTSMHSGSSIIPAVRSAAMQVPCKPMHALSPVLEDQDQSKGVRSNAPHAAHFPCCDRGSGSSACLVDSKHVFAMCVQGAAHCIAVFCEPGAFHGTICVLSRLLPLYVAALRSCRTHGCW